MFTIYGIFGSPFVRTIRIALEEKHLPWAWSPFTLGEHKTEPYLSRHPFGRIPAVEDDGFALYETNAVLRYLERKAPEPALIPGDLYRAGRMDQILCIVDNYLFRTAAMPIAFNRLIAPRIGVPVNEDAVAEAVPHARTVIDAINRLLAGPYLTGDALSLADIAVVPHLDYLNRTPEGSAVLQDYPRMRNWLEFILERPSVQASARPPEEVLKAG